LELIKWSSLRTSLPSRRPAGCRASRASAAQQTCGERETLRENTKTGGGRITTSKQVQQKRAAVYIAENGRKLVVENLLASMEGYLRVNTCYDRFTETFMAFLNLVS
jgi:hypothetical protein